MHLTTVKMKDGKEYRGIVWIVTAGLKSEPPYITLRTFEKNAEEDIDIPLLEIVSAVTEHERVNINEIDKDFDELPKWLETYQKYKKGELKL